MDNVGSVTQVTSHVAQQANEANKNKQVEKQNTEKASATFLGVLNREGDGRVTLVDGTPSLFTQLINSSRENGSNYSNDHDHDHDHSECVEGDEENTITSLNRESDSSSNSSDSTGNNTIFDAPPIPSLGVVGAFDTPIFPDVSVPSLTSTGNNNVVDQSHTQDSNLSTNTSTTPIFNVGIPSLLSSNGVGTEGANQNLTTTPIFNVAIPSLLSSNGVGTGGANQNSTNTTGTTSSVGSPLVNSSPSFASRLGSGIQSLLAGNTPTTHANDNEGGASSGRFSFSNLLNILRG